MRLFDTDQKTIHEDAYSNNPNQLKLEILDQNKYIRDNTNYVSYDDTMYNYPAIIAVDGYDNAYEYALLDEENDTIIYVALSYPESLNLKKYNDYLKKDSDEYKISGTTLDRFSIYSHQFPDSDAWTDY